ncbi:MAG: DNA mismatch repair protein MutS [Spirochaetales bacterium]
MAERVAMLDQYRRIKSRYRDVILFFRLGDFYEMFFDDAIEASSLLDLTLTKRQGQPMCGIPYHASKTYIAKLLKAGKKVAICEQLSAPGSKGIIERDVIEVVTPGTTIEEDFIDHGANNYLASVCGLEGRLCVSCLDVSTGEFRAYSSVEGSSGMEFLRSELYRLAPRELIIQQSLYERAETSSIVREMEGVLVERRPDWSFDKAKALEALKKRFGVASLKGFGFSDEAPEIAAAGILLEYLDENVKARSPHIRSLLPYDREDYLSLDEATRRNLELVKNLADSGKRDTLLAVLDRTKTAGGFRLLRQWILQPLRRKEGKEGIEARLDAVDYLRKDQLLLNDLRRKLGGVLDSERLIARLAMDKAHAKDILALRDSMLASIAIVTLLAKGKAPSLLAGSLDDAVKADCGEAAAIIDRSIKEDPSILLTEGNMIREGYSADLDRLRSIKKNSTKILEEYLEEEKRNSGISTLRIRYNKIIGYYLEVSKGKIDAVPQHFIRRQSLVAGERYTTDRLAEIESEINGATERIVELEKRLFLEIRESLKIHIGSMESLAREIAVTDCLSSFAQAATEGAYCRPELVDESMLAICQGRHPVVEACLPLGAFVPNDLELDTARAGFALITGPNMAGKSTVLRQTALIALMAHIGSFVPAESAKIGLVDKIFCRVGAQDNLARGESTFLVEMHETAYILNTATIKSLVIMDEVGRGTGTLDGVSIAWAVSEHLLDIVRCRTLFATHYHELTSMEHPHMKNLSMAVLENEGEIVFLKRLKEGPAAGSYGLHVAKLAGIPRAVLERAKELQGRFVNFEHSLSPSGAAGEAAGDVQAFPGQGQSAASKSSLKQGPATQSAELFSPDDIAVARLKSVDPDRMTPLEALQLIAELSATLH